MLRLSRRIDAVESLGAALDMNTAEKILRDAETAWNEHRSSSQSLRDAHDLALANRPSPLNREEMFRRTAEEAATTFASPPGPASRGRELRYVSHLTHAPLHRRVPNINSQQDLIGGKFATSSTTPPTRSPYEQGPYSQQQSHQYHLNRSANQADPHPYLQPAGQGHSPYPPPASQPYHGYPQPVDHRVHQQQLADLQAGYSQSPPPRGGYPQPSHPQQSGFLQRGHSQQSGHLQTGYPPPPQQEYPQSGYPFSSYPPQPVVWPSEQSHDPAALAQCRDGLLYHETEVSYVDDGSGPSSGRRQRAAPARRRH
ncbi:unnamed protein product [Mycena citricolor]|uniref:Uncharacterized protein n=1 Tax=Mycena citricolor TaxID=2018698 RepID=A0AAD2HR01_9AGAR|nr:unnamed protein product [Mycena citricolor]